MEPYINLWDIQDLYGIGLLEKSENICHVQKRISPILLMQRKLKCSLLSGPNYFGSQLVQIRTKQQSKLRNIMNFLEVGHFLGHFQDHFLGLYLSSTEIYAEIDCSVCLL